MPRHLFISISKIALAIACFLFPWIAVDLLFKSAIQHSNELNQLKHNLGFSFKGERVAIGDCTIYPFSQMGGPRDLRVLGFGGSAIKEWYYLIKNNKENFSTAKSVVIGTSHAFRYQYMYADYTSFLPFLMTWRDLYEYYFIEKRVFLPEILRFGLAKIFPAYSSSQSLRYQLFESLFPNYRNWYDIRNLMISTRSAGWQAQAPTGPQDGVRYEKDQDPDEYFRKLAEISKELNKRIVFILTPRSSWKRDEKYKKEVEIWKTNCEKFGVTCWAMSSVMPDSDFPKEPNSDGLHIATVDSLRIFWKKIETELQNIGF